MKIIYKIIVAIILIPLLPFKILWWFIKLIFVRETSDNICVEDFLIPQPVEPTVTKPVHKSISKVGSIIPIEEDHNLRAFTIMNSEGELFRIDTSVKGDFYGPVWTKILSCYEMQQTLIGRIIAFSEESQGFQIRIGNITGELPLEDSMRAEKQPAINVPLAITAIYPETKTIKVSSKIAYDRIFANESQPQQGEKSKAIYWDYDTTFVYLLLPGKYLAIAEREESSPTKMASLMGTTVCCNINSLSTDKREARVTILEENENPPCENISEISEFERISSLIPES